MSRKDKQIRIVTSTIQRCAECGWSHAPAVLAHNFVTNSAGFYCLDCWAEASNRGDLDPKAEVAA